MRNLFLGIFTMLLCLVAYAQELPKIIPPSPTAFELTKYGNTAVNESIGEISPSIPLYNFKSGSLSVPISLSYAGAGVKVNQMSSWTGINWNLRAGGVITRSVRDRADEVGNRKFYSDTEFSDFGTFGKGTEESVNILSNIVYTRAMYSLLETTTKEFQHWNFSIIVRL